MKHYWKPETQRYFQNTNPSRSIRETVVLVMDQDPEFRRMFSIILRSLGCEHILEADQNEQGWNLLKSGDLKPDMIFLNTDNAYQGYVMGKQLTTHAVLKELDLYKVMMSTDHSLQMEVMRFACGADALLTKPIRLKELAQVLMVFTQTKLEKRVRRSPAPFFPVFDPSGKRVSRLVS